MSTKEVSVKKRKEVCVIGAVSHNGVYGHKGHIPWDIPEDLAHFKRCTEGGTVVMGRGTWESLKVRPLPNRENIVVTNTPNYIALGAWVASSVTQAVEMSSRDKVFVIGGIDIWMEAIHIATELLITVVHKTYPVIPGATRLAPELLDPKKTSLPFECCGVSDAFMCDRITGDMVKVVFLKWKRKVW
jgi:dihydrofolate reductase